MKKCCATLAVVVMFFVDSNGRITTNCVKYISLVCTGLQICCTQYICEISFIGVLRTLLFVYQMHVRMDEMVNKRCATCIQFAYYMPQTTICQFFAPTQKDVYARCKHVPCNTVTNKYGLIHYTVTV